jgi:hypothetical protein
MKTKKMNEMSLVTSMWNEDIDQQYQKWREIKDQQDKKELGQNSTYSVIALEKQN